uniref:Immunoglobulin domain-containing protein n=1 Tax=Mola mola TaxID=94237 RepID=A0A3Q3XRS6_MOLML
MCTGWAFYPGVALPLQDVLKVTGHVGGEVSIHCSGNWNADNSSEHFNLYLCKEVCSRENTVIQTTGKSLEVTRRGRYRMEVSRGDGAFKVTITRLKEADTGRYHCGQGKSLIVLYQEVNLIVLNNERVWC